MSVDVSSKLRSAAVVAGVFTAAFVAAAALHHAAQRLGWLPSVSTASHTAIETATGAPGWSAWGAALPVVMVPSTMQPGAASLPAWRASLLVGGRRHAVEGTSIALPTGTRFQLALQGMPAGTVKLHTVNPQGVAAAQPLWTQRVPSGDEVVSPTLRLQGTRGIETLRVVHRDARGVVREGTVQLWHL